MQTETQAPTICLCMIVKNEADNLPRVIGSVKNVVDRMVVVDTGSDDNTVEVARALGAEVYLHPWEGPFDFAAARNLSLGYARDEDWILIMDGDDELELTDVPLLRRLAARLDVECWCFQTISTNGNGVEAGAHWLPRLYRNGRGYHYEGRVHNQLVTNGSPQTCSGVRVYHYGYGLKPAEMKKKWKRSAHLVAQVLKREPENWFQHYNFAVLLSNLGDGAKALKHLQIAINGHNPASEPSRAVTLMSLYLKAQINRRQAEALAKKKQWAAAARKFATAEAACLVAIDIDDRFPDCLLLLGELINRRGDEPQAAIKTCRKYLDTIADLRTKPRPHNLIINTMNLDYAGYYHLGKAYFKSAQGRGMEAGGMAARLDYQMAALNFQQAVYKAPANINFESLFELYGCLAFCQMQCNDFEAGIQTYRSMLRVMPQPKAEIYNNIGTAYGRLGQPRQARENYQAALAIDPNYQAAKFNLEKMGVDIAA